jgi:short-subunit dehydrogenase
VTVEEGLLDVTCMATLVLSHAAGRAMRSRGRGGILNVSSVASYSAMGTYAAAKSWVRVFSEGLSQELRGTGVTCMALCPGFVRTEFHDRARMNMRGLPDYLWLSAPSVVRTALDDAARGKVVSIPGAQYKTLVGLMGLVPQGVVGNVSARLRRRRRGRP